MSNQLRYRISLAALALTMSLSSHAYADTHVIMVSPIRLNSRSSVRWDYLTFDALSHTDCSARAETVLMSWMQKAKKSSGQFQVLTVHMSSLWPLISMKDS